MISIMGLRAGNPLCAGCSGPDAVANAVGDNKEAGCWRRKVRAERGWMGTGCAMFTNEVGVHSCLGSFVLCSPQIRENPKQKHVKGLFCYSHFDLIFKMLREMELRIFGFQRVVCF